MAKNAYCLHVRTLKTSTNLGPVVGQPPAIVLVHSVLCPVTARAAMQKSQHRLPDVAQREDNTHVQTERGSATYA